jgi:uncharacterized protein (DUF362 family)
MVDVAFVRTMDRRDGVKRGLKTLGVNPVRGKDVLIKPNFNTADRVPGSTDNETLLALVDEIWGMGAKSIAVGERSYPPTRDVMESKKIIPPLKERGVRIIDFDSLSREDWVEFRPRDTHWKSGFRVARLILEAECLVSTCCLKTHQYGGVFTLSLKLHVGVVPTFRHGFDYMRELHGSPHQRKLIAEINEPFSPALVVLDGVEAFVDEGPATGKRKEGNVFLVSTDRVATDAVGVAVLKVLGSNAAVMNRKVFEQEQISRAVELGLGAASPAAVRLISADTGSENYCAQVRKMLDRG